MTRAQPNREHSDELVQQFLAASREQAQLQVERDALRRRGFRVAVTLALAALVLAVFALLSRRAAITQMEQAHLRRNQAEDLIDFMLVDLKNKLDSVGRLDILEDVGHQAMAYFETLPADQLSGDSLARQVKALHRIGEVQFKQNDIAAALETFQLALNKAEILAARDPFHSDWQYQLVVSYFWLADMLRKDHNPEAALPYMLRYLAVAERMNEARPDDEDWIYELACAFQNLAAIHYSLSQWQLAMDYADRNIELTQSLSQRQPDDPLLKRDLADSLAWRAKLLMEQGHLAEARGLFTRALDLQKSVCEMQPDNKLFQYHLQEFHRHLARVLSYEGKAQLALAQCEAACSINEKLVASDPANHQWQHRLVLSYLEAGNEHVSLEQWQQANDTFLRAKHILDDLGEVEKMSHWRLSRIRLEQAMAALYLETNELTKAQAAITESLEAEAGKSTEFLTNHIERSILWGRLQARLGRHDEAVRSWETALTACRSGGADNILLQRQRALIYLYLSRFEEAKPNLESLQQKGFRYVPYQRELRRTLPPRG